jgi:hypothetical protein
MRPEPLRRPGERVISPLKWNDAIREAKYLAGMPCRRLSADRGH